MHRTKIPALFLSAALLLNCGVSSLALDTEVVTPTDPSTAIVTPADPAENQEQATPGTVETKPGNTETEGETTPAPETPDNEAKPPEQTDGTSTEVPVTPEGGTESEPDKTPVPPDTEKPEESETEVKPEESETEVKPEEEQKPEDGAEIPAEPETKPVVLPERPNPVTADEKGQVVLTGEGLIDFWFPTAIGEVKLDKVAAEAFRGCPYFKTVTIPVEIVEIGGFAFADCKNLTAIVLEGRANTDGMTLGEGWNGTAEVICEKAAVPAEPEKQPEDETVQPETPAEESKPAEGEQTDKAEEIPGQEETVPGTETQPSEGETVAPSVEGTEKPAEGSEVPTDPDATEEGKDAPAASGGESQDAFDAAGANKEGSSAKDGSAESLVPAAPADPADPLSELQQEAGTPAGAIKASRMLFRGF